MNERTLLRNYAREYALFEFDIALPKRGELAGKAFMALQNVLVVIEESEEKAIPVTTQRLRVEIRKALL